VTTPPTVILAPGKERSLLRRHPWVFTGAIGTVRGKPASGDTVRVVAANNSFLAWGAYSPSSQIAVRVWSFSESDVVDETFIASRVRSAAASRADLAARSNAARLVFAESDLLPGVIIDRYGSVAVLELTSAGADRWRDAIADACLSLDGITSVYERSDLEVRAHEGLQHRTGLLRGPEPPERVEVHEDGAGFVVDVRGGHKTGFYLDQRESRVAVRSLAAGRKVLNVFAYTGAFSVAAWQGGARKVTTVDSSGPALQIASENLAANGLPTAGIVEADAFAELRRLRDAGTTYDLVILDPPKLVHNRQQVDRGSRAYKDLNWLGLRLLNPGGVLVTFSCSGSVSPELHQKIVADAAVDAARDVQVIGRLHQASDHPVLLSVPETQYLKGLVCRVS
jgi:23S rRNA (cytosine1962-C5)-methyltransferase